MNPEKRNVAKIVLGILLLLVAVKLSLHFLLSESYGYHRDEFYYIECGKHLDFGFVDHPPFTPFLANVSRWILGDSLFSIRFFPAIAGAVVVFLAGLMARQLGGGWFAQILAAVAVLLTPRYLHANGMLQPVSFDLLFWVLNAYLVIRLLKTENPRYWILIGLVTGIGLINKHTMLFFCFGLFVGLILTPQRKYLLNRWLWCGAVIAFLLFLPNVIWQIQNDWPSLEFLQFINKTRMSVISASEFLFQGQLLSQQILAAPIWLAGLYYFFFTVAGKKFRLLGWIYVSILVLFLIVKAKPYYLGPAYPMLLAGGSCLWEQYISKIKLSAVKAAILCAFAIACVWNLPKSALPIHPVRETTSNDYKDMVGWDEMVLAVAEKYQQLSPEEKENCLIFTGNYGEAGAINYLGKKYGLPKAFSSHNSYWIWGSPEQEPTTVILLGAGDMEDVEPYYESVEYAGRIRNKENVKNEEFDQPFYIARNPKSPFKEIWPNLKHYD